MQANGVPKERVKLVTCWRKGKLDWGLFRARKEGTHHDENRTTLGHVTFAAGGNKIQLSIPPGSFQNPYLAASAAEVEELGYSPPNPSPVIPRETVNIHKKPSKLPPAPCEAVTRMIPMQMRTVERTMPHLRPLTSQM